MLKSFHCISPAMENISFDLKEKLIPKNVQVMMTLVLLITLRAQNKLQSNFDITKGLKDW